jgi:mannose-1-phosphate guanylyltransferase
MMLAAGLGTRLKPLTLEYPKPCVPFLNVPLGLYQFQYLKHLNISKLIVNTFHLPEKVQQLYQTQPYYRHQIFFSDESKQILGGAGGLKKASPLMKKDLPILLMNADEVYFTQNKTFLQKALEEHINNKSLATVVVIEHPEAGQKFGALWCDQNEVKDISKTAKHPNLKPWHCIGPIFVSWEILDLILEGQESNIFYDVLIHKLATHRVQIFPIKSDWYETGNPTDYFAATESVLKNLDIETIQFINEYDNSDIINNSETRSLISKNKIVDIQKLNGINVISKSTTRPLNEKIKDSVLFDQIVLNKKYFNL